MRHCIICDGDYEQGALCACGQTITRERATHLSTAFLSGTRKWWLNNQRKARLFPELAKRDRDRKALFAQQDRNGEAQ